jgi:hypothetical protein
MIAALLIGAFHIGYLRVPETYRALRYNHSAMRRPTVFMEIALAIGGLGVAALGGFGAGRFGFVVPPIDELFKSLWGTTFVAIVAAIVIAKTRVQLDLGRLVNRSRKEVGSRLRELARSEALKSGTDPDLVESVLLAENLERPRWFRQLERAKGRLFPHGSYGVMQVTSDSPINDEDSIIRAVAEHLHGVVVQRRSDGYLDYQSVETAFRQYNNDPVFVSLATQIFWLIGIPNNVQSEPVSPQISSEAPSEDVKAVEPEPELQERMELLARNARLCIVAAATLSTATIDELRILNDSLAAFVGNQARRPGGQSPVFPLTLIVSPQAIKGEQSTTT